MSNDKYLKLNKYLVQCIITLIYIISLHWWWWEKLQYDINLYIIPNCHSSHGKQGGGKLKKAPVTKPNWELEATFLYVGI